MESLRCPSIAVDFLETIHFSCDWATSHRRVVLEVKCWFWKLILGVKE